MRSKKTCILTFEREREREIREPPPTKEDFKLRERHEFQTTWQLGCSDLVERRQ